MSYGWSDLAVIVFQYILMINGLITGGILMYVSTAQLRLRKSVTWLAFWMCGLVFILASLLFLQATTRILYVAV